MATVDELLAGVSTVDKTLVISNDFRTINIPSSVPNLGVENDDDVLRLDFKMPRYVSDTDLSEFGIRINYMNARRETDVYTVSDKAVGSQYITFSWLVGPTATRYKGDTKFIVCVKIVDAEGVVEKEFNTTIATLPVLEGLEVDEAVVSDYTDVIEQWRRELFDNTDSEITKIQNASQREQVAINNKGAEVLATIPVDYRTAVSMTDNADRTKADAIVCVSQGETIRVLDSSDDYLRGLKVFGKTTKDGEHVPGSHINLINANLRVVKVCGKNLLDLPQHIDKNRASYNYDLFTGTAGSSQPVPLSYFDKLPILKAGIDYYFSYDIPEDVSNKKILIQPVADDGSTTIDNLLKEGTGVVRVDKDTRVTFRANSSDVYTINNIQLEVGTAQTVYEPYIGQVVNLPYTLSGIPVTSDGNYTDTNGQQWICDEIDFYRGVYIQRTKTIEFNGTESWYISATQYSEGTRFDVNIPNIPPALVQNVMCDRFVFKGPNAGIETAWVYENTAGFRVITTQATTPEEFQQFLSNNHTTIIYVIKEPIETKLTPEELEWFRFAHTNFPTTTVLNDAGATMELEYNADTKLWLDNAPKVTDEQAGPLVEAWMDEHFLNAEGMVYGRSAYEIAVEQGFQGSEEYWLATLKGRDGKDGAPGEPGADGYVPVKGTDYFTEADKEELAEDVAENVVDTLTSGEVITIDDHVIEQGRNDTWTWRKWASGVAEIWGKFTKDNARSSPVLPFNMVNYELENWPEPIINYAVHTPDLETDIPAIACCLTCSNNFIEEGDVVSWDVPDFVYINPLTNERFDDAVWSLDVHMLGRWKALD